MSLLFSVVRVHLADQNDPFGHTPPTDLRLSMADLEYTSFLTQFCASLKESIINDFTLFSLNFTLSPLCLNGILRITYREIY
mgnify:CR=1 FL=1